MTAGLNIAIFGSSLVAAHQDGAENYLAGIVRALQDRGHGVTYYEPRVPGCHEHPDPTWARVVVYSAENEDGVSRALAEAQHADLIVKASRIGIFDEFLEAEIPLLSTGRTSVVFWDTDAPSTLERMESNPSDSFIQQVPHYDLVLTYGGGYPVVKAYREFGAVDCVPIYNAFDPATHRPADPQSRFRADLSFLGDRMPESEPRVEEFLLQAAELAPAKTFLLGGDGWQDKPLPRNVGYVGQIAVGEHNAFNCSSQAVLSISSERVASNGYSPASRIFEAAGAGSCVITDAWEGIDLFLEPGEEVLVAKSGRDVATLLMALDPQHARAIGAAARRRVLSHHTYAHRALQFEEIIDAARAGSTANGHALVTGP